MVFFNGNKYYNLSSYSMDGRTIIVEKAVKKLKPMLKEYSEEEIEHGFLHACRDIGISVTPKRNILKFLDKNHYKANLSEIAYYVGEMIEKYVRE